MSFVGFKASNHPQQVSARGALEDIDDRRTPQEIISAAAALCGGRRFSLDVAANAENAKAERFYSIEDDGLSQPWTGRVWCNPPFSNCRPWVEKAWAEFDAGNAEAIAMLLPANRTEQAWWQELVEDFRDRPAFPLTVRFLQGRIRFGHPESWQTPAKGDRPPFGCCLLVWRWSTP